MGIGDEIMASGEAHALHDEVRQSVSIVDRSGRPRCHAMWDNLGFLSRGITEHRVVHGPRARPYYKTCAGGKFDWRRNVWPTPGVIAFSHDELRARDAVLRQIEIEKGSYVIFEPRVKGSVSANNKDWGWPNWVELTKKFREEYPEVPIISPLKKGSVNKLNSVFEISIDFRVFCAILKSAALVVTTDGALHHAAAALKVPTIVIWGGYSAPDVVGYEEQINIWHERPGNPCGNLRPCQHCRQAMKAIKVSEVFGAIRGAMLCF